MVELTGFGLPGKVHGKPMFPATLEMAVSSLHVHDYWLIAHRLLGPPNPPARPAPQWSDILVVADIPPVPPICIPDAARNEPQASTSPSSHLCNRPQRSTGVLRCHS
ncbi:Cytochrome P450 [Penicillium cf. griseofulvum]|uniref:Cytochrome P450 n=1 Tax=Penicillium cf. griseofulvum TaxID=2972120 RepID=A0A9W9N145_9EURO|nr:Cytochrome P450 [Penicillium cf. griseofulvum]KAJ5422232.1 Cytochrome P450 [Penicillium cf. griseofulvum]KAJ5428415.1 Cytochrome P450 [Penicillium cf. griseofulvum]